jgi:hypothetical protein
MIIRRLAVAGSLMVVPGVAFARERLPIIDMHIHARMHVLGGLTTAGSVARWRSRCCRRRSPLIPSGWPASGVRRDPGAAPNILTLGGIETAPRRQRYRAKGGEGSEQT